MISTTLNINDTVDNYIDFLYSVDMESTPYVSKDRIDRNFENYGKAMNTLMVYPDILADIMTPKNSSFSFFFEQRLVARIMARYRQSYFTFTRGFSKSFLAFYDKYTTCMFIPHHKAFIVAGTKTQAALIAKEKVIDDLWVKFPLLANEMKKFKVAGKIKNPYVNSGDSVAFNFTNGSIFDVIGGQIRGGRRHSGIFEEVITLDPVYINESVIPLLNTTRYLPNGTENPKEPQGKKTFITSAGFQGTYAYDKLMETLCLMLIDPDKYFVMGGSYKPLVAHGRLSADTMREILSSPTYNADQVDREYRSIWSTAVSGAMFEPGSIVTMRKIKKAEFKAQVHAVSPNDFYVVGVDLAYDGAADTAVIVARVTPGEYRFTYKLINLFTIDVANYEVVANILKSTCQRYNARMLIYDANGVGATLREHLNKISYTKSGDVLPAFGIINPPADIADQLRKVKDKSLNICYEIKSGGQKGSAIHGIFLGKMTSGAIRMLVKSGEAVMHYQKIKAFMEASSKRKDEYLKPYRYTDLFEEELKNLDFKQDLANDNMIKVIRRNDKIQKDFFSAAEYLVYAVVQEIELPYYKKKKEQQAKKYSLTSGTSISERSNTSRRRNGGSLNNRRRSRR